MEGREMTALNADQVPEKWSVLASSYEKAFEGLSSQFAAAALRLLKVKPGERLIDVAAGTGVDSLGEGHPMVSAEACIGIGRV
jgi:ubiquinone/menaquinone biosynthesis C-methylase UbiE